jgi:hypothetical protein
MNCVQGFRKKGITRSSWRHCVKWLNSLNASSSDDFRTSQSSHGIEISPGSPTRLWQGRFFRLVNSPNGRVEISIPAAEELFREIRLENVFNSVDGKTVALASGAQLTITFEAETGGTVPTQP